jgi:hypothetical protein
VTIVFVSRSKYDSFKLVYEKAIEEIPDTITTKAADVQGQFFYAICFRFPYTSI